jgi:hypothetical protein
VFECEMERRMAQIECALRLQSAAQAPGKRARHCRELLPRPEETDDVAYCSPMSTEKPP